MYLSCLFCFRLWQIVLQLFTSEHNPDAVEDNDNSTQITYLNEMMQQCNMQHAHII